MTPVASAFATLPRGLVAATAFMTRVPIGRFVTVDASAVASAAPFYPLVGAGLGALAGLAERGLSPSLPPLVVSGLLIAFLASLTGAMHLDALADTADALGGRSREDSLRIMRDHALGAYGTTALALALLVKLAAVAALIETGDAMASLVVACACSRESFLPLAAVLPYARNEERGFAASEQISRAAAGLGLAVAAAVAVIVAGAVGAVGFGAVLALAGLAAVFYRRWLGGVTGDALGAVVELAEVTVLTIALAAA